MTLNVNTQIDYKSIICKWWEIRTQQFNTHTHDTHPEFTTGKDHYFHSLRFSLQLLSEAKKCPLDEIREETRSLRQITTLLTTAAVQGTVYSEPSLRWNKSSPKPVQLNLFKMVHEALKRNFPVDPPTTSQH